MRDRISPSPGLYANLSQTRGEGVLAGDLPVAPTRPADGLGSIRNLVDSNEDAVNVYDYYAFGKELGSWTEAVENRYTYTAREYDAESEQYYYRARYYSGSGRFNRRDPRLTSRTNEHLYIYVTSCPTAYSDPSGMVPCNYCGPNMSPQLTREFVAAGLHFRLQTKGFNWLDWVAFYSYGRVIWMAQTGPLLDWTNISDSGYVDEVAISCPTGRACKKTYELCGHCVHDHVIGNIMFGYWMRLMGFSSITTDLAGDGAQICLDGDIGCEPVNWVDFEWDQAAYRIGEKIYDNAAESNYCDVITVGEWKAANGGEFYNPICALCPLPSYNAPVKKYPPYMGGLDE